jgi:hypothetical protein
MIAQLQRASPVRAPSEQTLSQKGFDVFENRDFAYAQFVGDFLQGRGIAIEASSIANHS